MDGSGKSSFASVITMYDKQKDQNLLQQHLDCH